MSDQITAAETTEAREIIVGQNEVMIDLLELMTGTDLDALRADLNAWINLSRLERMTQDDLRWLRVLQQNSEAMLNDPEAVMRYPYDEAVRDALFIAEFYTGDFADAINQMARTITPAEYAELQQEQRDLLASREAQRETDARALDPDAEPTPEVLVMGRNRLDFLASPDLQIGRIMAELNPTLEGLSGPEKMQRFRAVLLPRVTEILQNWADDNADFTRDVQAMAGGNWEANFLAREENGGVTTFGASRAGRAGAATLDFAGNTFGDLMTSSGIVFLSDDPTLKHLFPDQASGTPIWQAVLAGNFDAQSMVPQITERLEQLFPDTLEYERLQEYFGNWSGVEDEALTAEQLQQIREKLETIPRFFIGGEWEDKYHTYVREEVGGRGALDFDAWLMTQVNGWQKMFYQIVLMLTPVLNWWYNDSEDTDEQRYGEHWNRYHNLEGLDPDDGPGAVVPPANATEAEVALINADSNYADLLEAFRSSMGDSADLNIMVDGEPLSAENLPPNADFIQLLALANEINRAPLLAQGVEYDDLIFVTEHIDNQRGGDGINFYFEDGGIQMSYDFQALGGAAQYLDELAGASAGVAVASFFAASGWAFGPPGWIVAILAAGAGAAIAHFADIDNGDGLTYFLDGRDFNFDDFSPAEFHAAIEEMKEDVSLIQNAFEHVSPENIATYIDDFQQYESRFDFTETRQFPRDMFDEDGISPAFIRLLELPESFWNGYRLTQADLNTFAEFMDENSWWGRIDDSDDEFEVKDNVFEVHGSRIFWDRQFSSVSEFFEWLRS